MPYASCSLQPGAAASHGCERGCTRPSNTTADCATAYTRDVVMHTPCPTSFTTQTSCMHAATVFGARTTHPTLQLAHPPAVLGEHTGSQVLLHPCRPQRLLCSLILGSSRHARRRRRTSRSTSCGGVCAVCTSHRRRGDTPAAPAAQQQPGGAARLLQSPATHATAAAAVAWAAAAATAAAVAAGATATAGDGVRDHIGTVRVSAGDLAQGANAADAAGRRTSCIGSASASAPTRPSLRHSSLLLGLLLRPLVHSASRGGGTCRRGRGGGAAAARLGLRRHPGARRLLHGCRVRAAAARQVQALHWEGRRVDVHRVLWCGRPGGRVGGEHTGQLSNPTPTRPALAPDKEVEGQLHHAN